jgi:NAD(P)-dependent dehydrogenase (short-subunit alcohol dehydrogenase family)
VNTNLLGAVFVGTHAMRHMIEQGSGSIVNITSTAQLGLPYMAVYGATKGALASLTYSWSMDLAPKNVRVNAYSPTAMTAMTAGSILQPGVVPSAEENAGAVTYLLSDLSLGITGQVVQRRRNHLAVVSHPNMTDHTAVCTSWTAEDVKACFDSVLRENLQEVGWDVTRP